MPSVGLGMIGAGMVGQLCHLANYLGNPDCRVVALAELRPELGRQAADRFGVARLYRDHRELLGDPDIDAVVVVTRRQATGAIVLDAIDSGRHVLSEKPMAHQSAHGRRLADAAEARRLVYSVGYMKRHDAGVERGKAELERVLADGSLGAPVSVRGWCFGGNVGGFESGFVMTAEDRPDGLSVWRTGPDWLPDSLLRNYDAFLNVNVHIINLMRYLVGSTPAVLATDMQDDGSGVVRLDFSGIPGVLELATVASDRWNEGCEFRFERGSVRIELPPPFRMDAEASVEITGLVSRRLPQGGTWAFRRQAAAFVSDVIQRTRPLAPGIDAVSDLVTAEAIWRNHLGI
jgi:predicted dehydrogenase